MTALQSKNKIADAIIERLDEGLKILAANRGKSKYKDLLEPGKRERLPGYHPSEMSKCKRRIYYTRTGVKPTNGLTPKTFMRFFLGDAVHELLTLAAYEGFGDSHFAHSVICRSEKLGIVGELDGIAQLDGHMVVVDFKSASGQSMAGLSKPDESYVQQIIAYEKAMRIPQGALIYFDKEHLLLRGFDVPQDNSVWHETLLTIMAVEKAVKAGEPPPYEVSYQCRECPYLQHCNPPRI